LHATARRPVDPPGLLSIPEKWIEQSLKAIGRHAIWQRIGCPLIVTAEKTARTRLEIDLNGSYRPAKDCREWRSYTSDM
jgi:hypothetical protein